MTGEETSPDWTELVPSRDLRSLRIQDRTALRGEEVDSSWAEVVHPRVLGPRTGIGADDLLGRRVRMPPQSRGRRSNWLRRRYQRVQNSSAEDPWRQGQPRNYGDRPQSSRNP